MAFYQTGELQINAQKNCDVSSPKNTEIGISLSAFTLNIVKFLNETHKKFVKLFIFVNNTTLLSYIKSFYPKVF